MMQQIVSLAAAPGVVTCWQPHSSTTCCGAPARSFSSSPSPVLPSTTVPAPTALQTATWCQEGAVDFDALLRGFPEVDFAAAYGSGVFQQTGYAGSEPPMVDMVFAVANPVRWHEANMRLNPHHYSSAIARLGPSAVAAVQSMGAGLWFNTLIPMPTDACGGHTKRRMKYGVIATPTLADDLLNWRTLYISGRMHKPVKILRSTPVLSERAQINLRHAASAALFMLPQSFTLGEMLMLIAGISYAGDVRMIVGENPRKVSNIVEGNLQHLAKLYAPVLQSFDFLSLPSALSGLPHVAAAGAKASLVIKQDEGLPVKQRLIESLPGWLCAEAMSSTVLRQAPTAPPSATRSLRRPSSPRSARLAALDRFSGRSRALACRRILMPPLSRVVGKFSRSQTVKGLFTAGAGKSTTYVLQKLAKMAGGGRMKWLAGRF